MKTHILHKKPLNREITQFTLEKPWDFQAGQFTAFCAPCQPTSTKEMHYFSIASSPITNHLELHIQNSPLHPLEPGFLEFLKNTTELELTPPQGEAVLTDSSRPLLLIAGGSGFAPMKSIIETVHLTQKSRPIYLYWGVRHPNCLYLTDLIKSWQRDNPLFHFIPAISDETVTNERHGLVHEAVLQDFSDLSPYDIYLAGPFPMAYAARDTFIKKGATLENLFSDAFAFG